MDDPVRYVCLIMIDEQTHYAVAYMLMLYKREHLQSSYSQIDVVDNSSVFPGQVPV